MTMRVEIDRDRCAMAGECVYNHPWLFAFGDDDFPVVLVDTLTEQRHVSEAHQAVAVCPSGAISVNLGRKTRPFCTLSDPDCE